MSLINAFVLPGADAALLAVDTASVDKHSGLIFNAGKMIVLPHLGAAIGLRGTVLFGIHLHRQISQRALNFESLSDCLPECIRAAIDATTKEAPSVGLDLNDAPRAEVVIAGYSPVLMRVVIHHFRHEANGDLAEHRDVNSVVAPWDAAPELLQDISLDRDGLITVAKRQIDLFSTQHPAGTFGGELFIADVRRGSISIEHAATLTDRMTINPLLEDWLGRIKPGISAAIEEAMHFADGAQP